ncbi:natural cytotoxicity triggering receptor 3 ligand 1-like [Latimeria chalumnae]|uniref:natural cytotoxicity triggering receptor 3 ligand 1-like n=1 Tax=Latimeria chalumnae TaxID=7897 RepID=UPI00313AD3F3
MAFMILIFLLFLQENYAILTLHTDSSPVTAQVASDRLLKCLFEVEESPVNTNLLGIKWLWNGKEVAEYDGEVKAYQPGMMIFEGELTNGNASLLLTDIRIAHEGVYTCDILHGLDQEKRQISVKVEAPPKVTIPNPSVTENKTSLLDCNVEGYYPGDVAVWWLKDGHRIQGCQFNTTGRNPDSSFNTTSTYAFIPTEKDKYVVYSCCVNHTALKESLKVDVTLTFVVEGDVEVGRRQQSAHIIISSLLFVTTAICIIVVCIMWRKKDLAKCWETSKKNDQTVNTTSKKEETRA